MPYNKFIIYFLYVIISVSTITYARPQLQAPTLRRATPGLCQPLHTAFPASDVSNSGTTPFVAISPTGSYSATGQGLELYLEKPAGTVSSRNGVNDRLASGATVNSSFLLDHGKVTFTVSAPLVSGVVTAVILIADSHDEIDIELLGGDPSHWQTNVFVPSPRDVTPLYGVLSSIEDTPRGASNQRSIGDQHSYTIDWNKDRINWSVDGKIVRTLSPRGTNVNGSTHYPTHPARLQLGIWDASGPEGTSEWARGPINWKKLPSKLKATVHSITVECP